MTLFEQLATATCTLVHDSCSKHHTVQKALIVLAEEAKRAGFLELAFEEEEDEEVVHAIIAFNFTLEGTGDYLGYAESSNIISFWLFEKLNIKAPTLVEFREKLRLWEHLCELAKCYTEKNTYDVSLKEIADEYAHSLEIPMKDWIREESFRARIPDDLKNYIVHAYLEPQWNSRRRYVRLMYNLILGLE